MEIVFNNLSYVDNKGSSLEKKYFEDINLEINSGSIVSFISNDLDVLGKLLLCIKRPTKGELIIDNESIKRTSHIENVELIRKKIGYMPYSDNKLFLNNNIKDEIKSFMTNYKYKCSNVVKHIMDSLKMVGLDDTYLDRDPNKLSFVESKKVELACLLSYNPEVLILCDFEKGLNYKEREYFKKLFLKLKNSFRKTIILISSDLTFMFNLVDNVFLFRRGKLVIDGNKDVFYDDRLYKYMEMPKIVEFTKYVNSLGYNILEYTDFKELIKEIYRNVR